MKEGFLEQQEINLFEDQINLFTALKLPEDGHVDQQYWYFVHKTVLRIKSEQLTLAALDINEFLPKNISYKQFLEDMKKHKDWNFSTKELTKVRQRIEHGRANVTSLIIEDMIKMQIEIGFPIEDEIIKYNQDGKKIALSRRPSSRKLKLLGKQLSLGELFVIYQTTVFTYDDFKMNSGTKGPIRFSDERMIEESKIFKMICPKEDLKNSLLERVAFNSALLRFWEACDYDEPVFASTLLYLIDLYINDKSWWYWRDKFTFLIYHKNRKISHTHIIHGLAINMISEISKAAKKHTRKEAIFLRKTAEKMSQTNFESLSEYIKNKYFKF